MKQKPYEERNDLEKIQSQWNKLSGLHAREELSATIVRAATAAEIAANFSVRKEFEARSEFDAELVNSLLRWANGLTGKINHLLLPLFVGNRHHKKIKALAKAASIINDRRNAIVHQGEFSNQEEVTTVIEQARTFIEGLIGIYEPGFKLKDKRR